MKAGFIYVISGLYFLQALWYWKQQQWAPGFLVLFYALAGIPLIAMTK